MSLTIRVITPDKIVWNTTAEEAILPSTTGQLGILTSHASLITALEIGVLRIRVDNNWTPMVLLGGFAEVENDEVTVLVNGVEEIKEGDINAARAELEKASLILENAKTDREKIDASQNLKRISARVQALTFL
uniref:ATP synthase epsilon chain, chloroplastic n=1 Tax=Rhizochromulina marina TaxID=1034831 RepID=A0A514CQ03_9STRA|nr:ATP synthase CF1 epsilon subunit [Rhizochromulina marina]QDH81881.1 ATP synthase CF1 epsilon subunit [Rhizochromulina marina]